MKVFILLSLLPSQVLTEPKRNGTALHNYVISLIKFKRIAALNNYHLCYLYNYKHLTVSVINAEEVISVVFKSDSSNKGKILKKNRFDFAETN